MITASPAGMKLTHRMTTLHEEPVRPHTLNEEPEDCYSDPDYPEYEVATSKPYGRPMNRLITSHTVDSFVDIGKAAMNITRSTAETTIQPTTTNKTSTPSMTSSTSSGYGSQAVSISNLTNDDAQSVRSMNIDETPGKIIHIKSSKTCINFFSFV